MKANKHSRLRPQSSSMKAAFPFVSNHFRASCFCLGGVALICGCLQASAATDITGEEVIFGRWTKAKEPYRVHADLRIANLDIEPGVQVLLQGNFELEVSGALRALGTREQPITFTRPGQGGWGGILFNNTDALCELRWCNISGSVNGGVRILYSNPRLNNCRIMQNTASQMGGGGILAMLQHGTLELNECVISGNTVNPVAGQASFGGGIFVMGDAVLRGCTIEDNVCRATCTSNGYQAVAAGGGVASWGGNVAYRGCRIMGNTVRADGYNNWLIGKAWALGGAVGVFGGTSTFSNCVLAHNRLEAAGGIENLPFGSAITCGTMREPTSSSSSVDVTNCTVTHNEGYSALHLSPSCSLRVSNSVVFFNGGTQIDPGAVVAYSDVQAGYPGTGNLLANPIFLDDQDFRLAANSPCIDAGNPGVEFQDTCFPPSLGGLRNDIGAYGGPGACSDQASLRIIQPPQNQSACIGHQVTFTVQAAGTGPLTYQWQRNGVPIPGEMSATLVLTSVSLVQAGEYSVIVSNGFSSVISQAAILEVRELCLDVRMYAGITLTGQVGREYVISYAHEVNSPVWTPLATVVLDSSEQIFFDKDSADQPHRFYRAEPKH